MKCSNRLCLSCCQMSQRVHHLTCNFKAHLSTPSSGDSFDLTQGSSEQLQSPQQSSHKQIQSAQANWTITSTPTPSQLLEYCCNLVALPKPSLYKYHQNLQAVALLANS
ncbi:hypothetical protein KEM48_009713 [Puccinia striiformis f. sp. tritici PST-130]|nr:hypothetical protein KEM48_009713 [Puccinia striiformis f. sp. tritici PST-130]